MKKVEKKILPKYYEEVLSDEKLFDIEIPVELRNDEYDLEVGDVLVLKEWDGERFTGRFIEVPVRYIISGDEAIQKGWYVIGL